MKELRQLSKALESLGYSEISQSILKIGELSKVNKPQKIKVTSTPLPNNQGYTLSITPIMSDGKTGKIETIQYSTSEGSVKLLPDRPFQDVVNTLFGPGTMLSGSMVDLQLSPGKTPQDFDIVIK